MLAIGAVQSCSEIFRSAAISAPGDEGSDHSISGELRCST